MRRFLKYLVIVVGLVAVFMIAVQLTLGGYEGKFEARIDALRRSGDPLDFADLAQPPIPDDGNAAKLWEEAAAWLKAHGGEGGWCLYDLAEAERSERPEKEWRACLESLEPYYELLKQVPTRPGWSVPYSDPDTPGIAAHVSWMHDTAMYLRLRVELDPRAEGRTERAAEAVLLLLDLAERWQDPTVIGYYIRLSMKSSAALVVRSIHGKPGFDAHLYRQLVERRIAAAAPRTGPPAPVLRAARVRGLWMVRRWLSGNMVNTFTGAPFEYERVGEGIRIDIPEIQEEWLLGDAS